MMLARDRLGFWVSIPKLLGQTYSAWNKLTVPFVHSGQVRQIRPEVTSVGLGFAAGKIIELSNCEYNNPRICPSPIEYNSLECVSGILNKNAEKMAECEMVELHERKVYVHRVSANMLMLSSQGETIEERCKQQPVKACPVLNVTYVLHAKAGCIISSCAGWRFRFLMRHSKVVNTTDVFSVDVPDVKFKVDRAVEDVKFNETRITELIGMKHHELPRLSRMHQIQVFITSGSTFGMVGFILGVAVTVFICVLVYRKMKLSKKLKQTVVQPTQATQSNEMSGLYPKGDTTPV